MSTEPNDAIRAALDRFENAVLRANRAGDVGAVAAAVEYVDARAAVRAVMDSAESLSASATAVCANWEGGDLAGAVQELDADNEAATAALAGIGIGLDPAPQIVSDPSEAQVYDAPEAYDAAEAYEVAP
jgi:hypothetical protein